MTHRHIRLIAAVAFLLCLPNAMAQFFPDDSTKKQRLPVKTCSEVADPNSSTGRSMHCVDSPTLTNPRDIAVKKCQDEARPLRGTPQWGEHLQVCLKRVMDDHPLQSKHD